MEKLEKGREDESWFKTWMSYPRLYIEKELPQFKFQYLKGLRSDMWGVSEILRYSQNVFDIGFRVVNENGDLLIREDDNHVSR